MVSYDMMILYLPLLFICSNTNLVSGIIPETRCVDHERIALLQFKKALVDDYALLNSWKDSTNARDCCRWRGVGCNNSTGQVIALHLSGTWSDQEDQKLGLSGEIDSSLLSLSSLTYLDLSGNNFTRIPEFIGSLKNLHHLNLSGVELTSPKIPDQLGNLSNLQTLDLLGTPVFIKDTHWLSSLSSLKYLDLSNIYLSYSVSLLNTAIKLPSLVELRLRNSFLPVNTANSFLDLLTNLSNSFSALDLHNNDLPSDTIYPWLFNFSRSLSVVNLSVNKLLGTIPDAFGTFRNLKTLDLGFNNGLKGGIPSSFRNLSHLHRLLLYRNDLDQDLPSLFSNLHVRSLQVLGLSWNRISGSLPDFTTFSALTELYLDNNRLNGSFPRKFQENSSLLILHLWSNRINGLLPDLSVFGSLSELYLDNNLLQGTLGGRLGSLSKLKSLDASFNFFSGTITEQHFVNLSRLVYLDLSHNSLTLNLKPDWSPPFQLGTISLSSCKLRSSFPTWLKTQKNLVVLDISNNGISGTVPNWFWESVIPRLQYLNLSSNEIYGTVPDLVSGEIPLIDLGSNSFSGSLPLFPANTAVLIVRDNMFSGPVSSLCHLTTTLSFLDLSNNKLSGKLPNCWNSYEQLFILNLENNEFTGEIPDSIGALRSVFMMSMRGNRLTGELPSFLRNCTDLGLLDLGENMLSGKIPEWIGESFWMLRVLSLSSNRFHGAIPASLCMLKKIQILDLSVNIISGTIPKCVNNLSGMSTGRTYATIGFDESGLDHSQRLIGYRTMFKETLQWKGRQSEYRNTLGLVVSLDLSSNRLTGEIPDQITSLLGLVAVNLSRNSLTGPIPEHVGLLRWLDFLDLSRNHLAGGIPLSLSQLSNLGVLDVSFNNLSGRIPKSTQLQSFDMSSYTGNPTLCGVPLLNECPGDGDGTRGGRQEDIEEVEDDGKWISNGFYVSIVIGFVFGFWGLCGSLLVSDSWRHGYFGFLKMVKDKTIVTVEISFARLYRRTPT
ncbi:hypothetical protein SSX86_017799 [Deinandra increscens subsp. villosa]|uniref:Leucine-rich repeat-containing N-terminal plant-type domain-containing protein n=1 Tax=Deinandra increscens subsp. villosa TaxID=3103831 RepID=A0AAP0GXD5_9ASTR